jgi:hypothetical protein
MKPLAAFLILICFPLSVMAGEVYQWVDNQGITHFTDNPATVPEDYRGEMQIREIDENFVTESPGETEVEQYQALDEEGILEEEGILVEDDLLEKDEEWWRNLAEKWRNRVQTAYENYEGVRLQYNDMATEFNASQDREKRDKLKTELDRLQVEMKEFMADLEQAKKMRDEVLPSMAKRADKPLEWVR